MTQYTKMTNKMHLCRIIYYYSSNTPITSKNRQRHTCVIPEAVIQLDAPYDERKYRSKHIEQPRNNKLSYTVASCWSFSYIQGVSKPMSQTFPGYSPPPLKQKSSYQHGSKTEQVARYRLLCRNPRNVVINKKTPYYE